MAWTFWHVEGTRLDVGLAINSGALGNVHGVLTQEQRCVSRVLADLWKLVKSGEERELRAVPGACWGAQGC